tara:strand:+ start:628 stop:906 length:279 start_codon:yes stop_codon:yes gene_type:complete
MSLVWARFIGPVGAFYSTNRSSWIAFIHRDEAVYRALSTPSTLLLHNQPALIHEVFQGFSDISGAHIALVSEFVGVHPEQVAMHIIHDIGDC